MYMASTQSTAPLFGYHMPDFSFPGVPAAQMFDHVVELTQAAESAGFDLVTVMDHFYQIRGVGPETEPMLEAYSTLAALAARTSRVRLGTLVTGVTYRNPALLAKTVTTLDIISKGRAMLGIGAAWNQDEHLGYGFDFPPVPERMDRLDEALTIVKLLFTQDRPSFAGRFYRIERAPTSPARSRLAAPDPRRRWRRKAHAAAGSPPCGHDPLVYRLARRIQTQVKCSRAALPGRGPRPIKHCALDRRTTGPGP
jgi:alkanesulfonate monooxygenase SsuD/methylene tetrahydromethanopterin reductase-like flavin-dependent oxidoreductase (luciferase family)